MKKPTLIIALSICSTMFAQTITTTELLSSYDMATKNLGVKAVTQIDYLLVPEDDNNIAVYDVSVGNLIERITNTDPLYKLSDVYFGIYQNTSMVITARDGKTIKLVDSKTKSVLCVFNSINGSDPYAISCFTSTKDKKLRLLVYYKDGRQKFFTTNTIVSTSIQQSPNNDQPTSFSLQQNFPNPFNPTTSIQYSLSKPSDVKINIYDITGRLVKTLEETNANPGEHIAFWDSRDNSGSLVASGTYIYQLVSNGYAEAKKMLLLK